MDPLKDGWEDAGNNLVKNTQTGQMVDRYHPIYANSQSPGMGSQPQIGGDPNRIGTTPAPQNAQQALTQPASVGRAPQPGQPATVAGSFQQALLNRLNQPAVTANSASVQPAIQANQLAEQRGLERNRAMLAERNAAQGLNMSGGNESMLRGLVQDSSARQGQFAGGLIADQQRAQDQQLSAMLGLTGGLLGQQDSLGLQRYGIDTDAALRREGLGATTALGQGDLALRGELGRGNLNLGLASLLQGGEQFGQRLGADLGMFGANLNQNALLTLLGAL